MPSLTTTTPVDVVLTPMFSGINVPQQIADTFWSFPRARF